MFTYSTRNNLSSRLECLNSLIEAKTRALDNAPEGRLKVSSSHGKEQFHIISGDKTLYVSSDDSSTIRVMAQKMYDNRVLKSALREKEAISKALSLLPPDIAENVIEQIPDKQRKYIKPILQPDEAYIDHWLNSPFEQKTNDKDHGFKSRKGDLVMSKSELIIADRLYSLGIPYRYEAALKVGSVTLHPDFTILDLRRRREVYLEHLGMMDDPGYIASNLPRLNLYQKNNILLGDRLFITYETKELPLDIDVLDKVISRFIIR